MIERKWLAHYIDSGFSTTTPTYVRLGRDLEEYNEELSPNISSITNILGEKRVRNSGYDVSASVSPYFTEYDDALSSKIWDIANRRLTGDDCRTTVVDVLLSPPTTDGGSPTVIWAYRRPVFVAVDTTGGNTEGVQTPFTLHDEGIPERVNFDFSTNTVSTYTPSGTSGGTTGGTT